MFLTLVDTHSVLSMWFAGNHVGGLTQIVEDDLDFDGDDGDGDLVWVLDDIGEKVIVVEGEWLLWLVSFWLLFF